MQGTPQQPTYEITEQDKARIRRIAAAWQAYEGEFAEQLEETPEGINPNANSNRCEPVVFGSVNFLFGKPLEISVDQGSPQEAKDFLDDTWGRTEKRMPLLQDLATSGAIAGQAFLRIVPNKDATQFNLTTVDPMTVFVQTATQDCKTVLLYCIEYSCQQTIAGSSKPVQVFYREEIQRIDPDGNAQRDMPDDDDTWIINHWTRVGDRGPWASAGNQITWPYNFPPIFTCQNRSAPHDFWGKPDITPDLIQQNEDINLVQSNAQMVSIIYGMPFLYAPGMGEGTIDRVPGKITQLPLPENKIESVNIQTDLANTLSFLANLRANMDEQSAVPAVALGRQESLPKGQVSGITMELLFMPLLAKTEMKRCRYGELIIDVSKALLALGNFSPDIDVTLTWKQPLPHDDLQSAQAIQALQAAGVSVQTSLEIFGIDASQEEERRNAEQAKQQVVFSRGQGMPPSPPQQQQQQQPPAQPNDQQQQEQGAQQ